MCIRDSCNCNWKIKYRSLLADTCRRQIDYNLFRRHDITGITHGSSYPFCGFLYLRRQVSHHMKHWKSVPCICLYLHKFYFQTQNRCRMYLIKSHIKFTLAFPRQKFRSFISENVWRNAMSDLLKDNRYLLENVYL